MFKRLSQVFYVVFCLLMPSELHMFNIFSSIFAFKHVEWDLLKGSLGLFSCSMYFQVYFTFVLSF